jgi:hypothetical protein
MPNINPGDVWQTVINANPNGTVFTITGDPGTPHTGANATHVPKTGQQFIASTKWVPGSTTHPVIDGGSTNGADGTQFFTVHAPSGGQPDSCVYDGLEVKRFRAASQACAFQLVDSSTGTLQATNYTLRDLYVHDCYRGGIRLAPGTQLLGTNPYSGRGPRRFLVDNILAVAGDGGNAGALGVGGGFGSGVVVDGLEISNINSGHVGLLDFETGGTKFVRTVNAIVRNSYVHDNYGPNIWFDICNYGFNVYNNWSENAWRNGYVNEIGYHGRFHHNVSFRDGLSDTRAEGWNGAFFISNSGGSSGNIVEVDHNWVYGSRDGYIVEQNFRGTAAGDPGGEVLGPYICQNVWFHHNAATMPPAQVAGWWGIAAGGLDDSGTTMGAAGACFSSRNNKFTDNLYSLPSVNPVGFAWNNGERSWATWQGLSYDGGAHSQDVGSARTIYLAKMHRGSD